MPAGMRISSKVRVKGLEPPRLAAPDPKSGVYTNFTTPAFPERGAKVRRNSLNLNLCGMESPALGWCGLKF